MKIYYLIFIYFYCLNGLCQNKVLLILNEAKKAKLEYWISEDVMLKETYAISKDTYESLAIDAIKFSGTDENIWKLKQFYTLSFSDEKKIKILDFLKENDFKFTLISEKITPPPFDIAPVTPNYFTNQGYIQSNPGVNMQAVWNLGYTGQNVTLRNVEYGFNKNHEEFNDTNCAIAPNMTVNSNASIDYTEHGTATFGVIFGHNGTYGITGLAHGLQSVWLYPEWQESGYNRINAITQALNASVAGDIIVFEMQTFGNDPNNQFDYVPAETELAVWNLTKALTDSGRVVVAAAGNGNQNLDSNLYSTYTSWGDSGAIIVGGSLANTTHNRIFYSTYGSRINVNAWAESVATSGAIPSTVFSIINNDFNQTYMTFAGTSSATAIVGGIAAVLQSYYHSQTNNWLTSQQIRTALQITGINQSDTNGLPIGTFPNTLAALNYIQQTLDVKSNEFDKVFIYPNPTTDVLFISQVEQQTEFEIIDLAGKNIQKGITEKNIDVSNLSKGVYFLKIHLNDNVVYKKFIKN